MNFAQKKKFVHINIFMSDQQMFKQVCNNGLQKQQSIANRRKNKNYKYIILLRVPANNKNIKWNRKWKIFKFLPTQKRTRIAISLLEFLEVLELCVRTKKKHIYFEPWENLGVFKWLARLEKFQGTVSIGQFRPLLKGLMNYLCMFFKEFWKVICWTLLK